MPENNKHYAAKSNMRVAQRFTDPEKDTQPTMTRSAHDAAKELTEIIKKMSAPEREAALAVASFLYDNRSSAGYKRLFGLTLPTVLANIGNQG